jgi:hypothetical protein
MFFELACGVFKAKAENPKLAKVTVEGDTLTIPEIIEHLKKIVPSDKFNWEVFHFKDNIYRVKLPSKLEVQRLKNFGTYICTDKEACLAFDYWSSVEEPLHMLPEVWVRVSGLPSDVRSDYLTLWGVGTLFGKTLDVDMAYTRKNKVLRTKIGCLDHRLIPADSDMFIRRGFYKLRFEVEIEDKNQEVNMEDANNDVDGENGENQGGGKNGDAHDMDMDHRGNDKEEASKENDHDGSTTHNGVAGMQEQCGIVEAVRVGTMEINLSPPGNLYVAKNLNQKKFSFNSLFHEHFPALHDNLGANYHADSLETAAASGSVRAGLIVSSQSPAIGQMLSAAELAPHAANGEMMCAAESLLSANQRGWAPVTSSQAGDSPADVAAVPTVSACGGKESAGSSAPREGRSPVAAVQLSPQTMRHAEAGRPVVSTPVSQVLQPMMGCNPGSAVHCHGVVNGMNSNEFLGNKNGMNLGIIQQFDDDFFVELPNADIAYSNVDGFLEPGLFSSLKRDNGSFSDKISIAKNGDSSIMGIRKPVGVVSSLMSKGKSLYNNDASALHERSNGGLSIMEIPSVTLTDRPTEEEVIAFGGIPKSSLEARTSARLGGQLGVDMTQMEKAMRNAQMRDASSCAGMSVPPKFSIVNIPDNEIIHKAERLGISLGKSEGEIVKSIKGIKLLEEERILTMLHKNVDEYVSREDDPSTLVMSKVSTLCEDLIEDDGIPLDLDDHLEHLKPVVKEKKTRVRKIYDTNNIRKSTRRRIKKQFS